MIKSKYILFFTLLAASIILNFNMPKKVIDQIQMVTVVGYDYIDKDTFRGTVITPSFLQQNMMEDLSYSGTASSIYENRGKLDAKASEELYNGKIEVALFNEEMARKGLSHMMDYMLRDPGIGSRLFLAVVKDGSTQELLLNIEGQKGAGIYLSDLIEHNIRNGNLPQTSLKQFNRGLKTKTIDPFLPVLTLKDVQPSITDLAFFDGDKLVDMMPYDKAFPFKMLLENIGDGQYNVNTEKYTLSIQNIESKRNVHVLHEGGETRVTFNVKFTGVAREYTGGNLSKNVKKVEKELEKNFKKNSHKIIKRFQELNIDPLGIEEHVKSRLKSYSKKRFKEQYKEMTIEVKIKFNITETGITR